MNKKIRNVLLIVMTLLLLTAVAGCGEKNVDNGAPLEIKTLKSMPSAYLN